MKAALAASLLAVISPWRCTGRPPPIHEIESLTIVPRPPPSGPGGASRTVQVAGEPAAAALVRALGGCRGPELAKFLASHDVVAKGRDGAALTLLVRGRFVKIDGVAYGCDEDVEQLVRALGRGQDGPAR